MSESVVLHQLSHRFSALGRRVLRHQGVCIKANVLRRRSLLAMVFFEAIKTILFCGASTIITVVLKTCVGVPLTMKRLYT